MCRPAVVCRCILHSVAEFDLFHVEFEWERVGACPEQGSKRKKSSDDGPLPVGGPGPVCGPTPSRAHSTVPPWLAACLPSCLVGPVTPCHSAISEFCPKGNGSEASCFASPSLCETQPPTPGSHQRPFLRPKHPSVPVAGIFCSQRRRAVHMSPSLQNPNAHAKGNRGSGFAMPAVNGVCGYSAGGRHPSAVGSLMLVVRGCHDAIGSIRVAQCTADLSQPCKATAEDR